MRWLLSFIFLMLSVCISFGQTIGLFLNDEDSYQGYTLLTPVLSENTYLIDNCGKLVNSWESDYRPGIVAYLLEDGRLMRSIFTNGDFQGGGVGGGIEIRDWDGNLEWSWTYASDEYHLHHDLEMLPNGNILAIAWELKTREEAIQAGRQGNPFTGLWPDHIIEIKPIGSSDAEIVWEWHLWDHLIQDADSNRDNYGVVADHPELLDINFNSGGMADFVHCNAVDYNPSLDQILISSKSAHEIWIIDHSTTTEEAAGHTGGRYGKGGDFLYRWGNPANYNQGDANDQTLFDQHDSHWITEGLPQAGSILLFNNRGGSTGSSVDVIQTPVNTDGTYIYSDETYGPESPIFRYEAPGFYSSRMGGAQQLPNGNKLICESTSGEIFEITPEKQVVWEYISPIGAVPAPQGSNPNNNSMFRAYRYGPEYGAFIGKNLIPGDPIELNPLDYECETIVSSIADLEYYHITTHYNIPAQSLMISNPNRWDIKLNIYNLTGRVMYTSTFTEDHQIQLDLNSGIYFVSLVINNEALITEKIILP